MTTALHYTQDALAALEWMIELGADETLEEAPVNRFALPAAPARPATQTTPAAGAPLGAAPIGVAPAPRAPAGNAVKNAQAAARSADTLEELRAAMADFEDCALRKGARNLVFCDGHASAELMIVGEAPGREEDAVGRPFVGRAGQLLDRMLAAINRKRTATTAQEGVYITNVLPWRPPRNRDPEADEIAMMRPFLERHIALAQPRRLVVMGNIACQALLGKKGITRLRGQWQQAHGLDVLPMFHPAYLLRNPAAKALAWQDLLTLRSTLNTAPTTTGLTTAPHTDAPPKDSPP